MEHSPKYWEIRDFYDHGRWSKDRVHKAVEKNWITASEYYEITGEVYS